MCELCENNNPKKGEICMDCHKEIVESEKKEAMRLVFERIEKRIDKHYGTVSKAELHELKKQEGIEQ